LPAKWTTSLAWPDPSPGLATDAVDDVRSLLAAAAEAGLSVDPQHAALLARYCRVLWDWNTRINLTRHTDWRLFVTRDLTDSLELSGHVPAGARVLDMGSGGGVPGIPLAILRPDVRVELCESVGKKAAALRAIIEHLQLPVTVHAERAEVVLLKHRYDVVTARAVASLQKLLGWLAPVWNACGMLLLIKGPKWVEERREAQSAGVLNRHDVQVVHEWSVPGRDHASVLLRVTAR
jgi:16S rRNA (guanine527-N7)-methyltransferase